MKKRPERAYVPVTHAPLRFRPVVPPEEVILDASDLPECDCCDGPQIAGFSCDCPQLDSPYFPLGFLVYHKKTRTVWFMCPNCGGSTFVFRVEDKHHEVPEVFLQGAL